MILATYICTGRSVAPSCFDLSHRVVCEEMSKKNLLTEVILLLQCVSTHFAQQFGRSKNLVLKIAAMAAVLDFQST